MQGGAVIRRLVVVWELVAYVQRGEGELGQEREAGRGDEGDGEPRHPARRRLATREQELLRGLLEEGGRRREGDEEAEVNEDEPPVHLARILRPLDDEELPDEPVENLVEQQRVRRRLGEDAPDALHHVIRRVEARRVNLVEVDDVLGDGPPMPEHPRLLAHDELEHVVVAQLHCELHRCDAAQLVADPNARERLDLRPLGQPLLVADAEDLAVRALERPIGGGQLDEEVEHVAQAVGRDRMYR